MAKSLRIDAVTALPNGGVAIAYTFGNTPLPVEPSGQAMEFSNRAAIAEAMQMAEERFDPTVLFLWRLAIYANTNNDPNLTKLTPAMLRNKSMTINLTSSTAPSVID